MARIIKELLLGLLLFGSFVSVTPTAFLTPEDKSRLKGVFDRAWSLQDLPSVHYAILGYRLLAQEIPDSQRICKFIQSKAEGSPKSDVLYHVTGAASELEKCSVTLSAQAVKSLDAVLNETPSVQDIFFSFFSLKRGKHSVDDGRVLKTLLSALKRDDSVLNLGYSFHIASMLQGDVQSVFERIEDAIVQADEVDGRMLQFEGGLSVTATILNGAYAIGKSVNKAPTITADQAVKFGNYILSRRSVQQVKGAYLLLKVLHTLADNKFHIPVAVSLASSIAISPEEPMVRVRITDLLGKPLGPLTVTARSDPMLDATPMTAVPKEQSMFELNLLNAVKEAGFYKLVISASPAKADPRLVGTSDATVTVKVLTRIAVEGAELGIADADHSTISKHLRPTFPDLVKETLDADSHQKVWMKFSLTDEKAKGEPILAHQAFIRLQKVNTKQEIIFVAEPDNNKLYKFDMEVHAKAKEFGSMSGLYRMELIVGDPVISNPFSWHVANLNLKFADEPVSKPQQTMYEPKPEIKHIFREPEKRPPAIVSNTFTLLVLVPLLILFGLWIKLGVNMQNFPLSLASFGFHLSLAGIFGLFVMFWLKLDMFTSLKYLIGMGLVAFLTGNSMLAKLAENRK